MKGNKEAWVIGVILVAVAAASRLLPHWHNFTAVGAAGLFGAYYFRSIWAYAIPLFAMWVSDLILNNVVYSAFNEGFVFFSKWMIFVYIGFASIVLIGRIIIKKVAPGNIIKASLLGTMAFFVITNFGAFLQDPIYLKTPSHLVLAYVAGLPFLLNTLLANLFFAGVFFGVYQWAVKSQSISVTSIS